MQLRKEIDKFRLMKTIGASRIIGFGTLIAGFVSMIKGADAGTMDHEVAKTPQYRRITLQKFDEFPLIYQLLESYVQHPELAQSVKEIMFLPQTYSVTRFHKPSTEEETAFVENEAKRDVSREKILYEGIKLLNLSAEHEENWVRILTWMKPEVVELRRSHLERTEFGSYFLFFVAQQGREFMYHATALLLMLCSNVERLVYRDNIRVNPVEETLRRINYDLLPDKRLRQLRDVVLFGNDEWLWSDEEFYTPVDILNLVSMFHRLPSIKNISAETLDTPRGGYVDVFPPGTSNIRKISITHSAFGSDVMAALIRAPKVLEDLAITTGGRASWDTSFPLMCAKEVGQALWCQRHSLRRLDLDLGRSFDAADYGYPDEDTTPATLLWGSASSEHRRALESRQIEIDKAEAQGPLRSMKLPEDRPYGAYGETVGSLHDYENLTHLSISLQHLRGGQSPPAWSTTDLINPPFKMIDVLPPNLEYLLIRGYTKGQDPDVDAEFAEILKVKSTKFPKLQQIYGIDEPSPVGEHTSRSDPNPELLWRAEPIESGWLEHAHDEL